MLQGAYLKAIIWAVSFVGIAPALFTVHAVWVVLRVRSRFHENLQWLQRSNLSALTHDLYFQAGPIRLDFYPRAWAALAVCLGIFLILGGLALLLHVPLRADE